VIRSVEIKCLRGIRTGVLSDLTSLVVLVGPNGSGKSTVLDALLIAANPRPPVAIGQAVERREGAGAAARWLLWKGGNDGPAEITVATGSGSRKCTLSVIALSKDHAAIEGQLVNQDSAGKTTEEEVCTTTFEARHAYGASGLFQTLDGVPEVRFIDPRAVGLRTPLHQLYTRVVEQGLHKGAIASLRALIPGVEDIQILAEGDSPVVYLIFGAYAVPATLAGDGIRLLLHLNFELATQPGGLVLMEEPEVHMHPGAIRQCARAILAAMRRKVQIVLSTHSLELIDALVGESSDDDLKQLSLYRLQLQAGSLKSSRLPGPEVAFARTEIQDDLR
jgi:ABC-type branched-subunit amino acid transport system ATPase component